MDDIERLTAERDAALARAARWRAVAVHITQSVDRKSARPEFYAAYAYYQAALADEQRSATATPCKRCGGDGRRWDGKPGPCTHCNGTRLEPPAPSQDDPVQAADDDLEAAIDREAAEADGATYDLVESFNVDDGELDPRTDAVSAFVLGVEWQLTLNEIKTSPAEFTRTVHVANVPRLTKLGWRHRRPVTTEISSDPSWAFLTFAERKP